MSQHNVPFERKYVRIVLHHSVRVTPRAPRRKKNLSASKRIPIFFNQELSSCIKEQMRRQRRSNTRCFLRKCQPPACQRVPVATTDRSVKDAVPGPEDGKNQADYRVGKTCTRSKKKKRTVFRNVWRQKQWCLGSEEPIVPSRAWQNDVNEGLGGQHLADFAIPPHAVCGSFRV